MQYQEPNNQWSWVFQALHLGLHHSARDFSSLWPWKFTTQVCWREQTWRMTHFCALNPPLCCCWCAASPGCSQQWLSDTGRQACLFLWDMGLPWEVTSALGCPISLTEAFLELPSLAPSWFISFSAFSTFFPSPTSLIVVSLDPVLNLLLRAPKLTHFTSHPGNTWRGEKNTFFSTLLGSLTKACWTRLTKDILTREKQNLLMCVAHIEIGETQW